MKIPGLYRILFLTIGTFVLVAWLTVHGVRTIHHGEDELLDKPFPPIAKPRFEPTITLYGSGGRPIRKWRAWRRVERDANGTWSFLDIETGREVHVTGTLVEEMIRRE